MKSPGSAARTSLGRIPKGCQMPIDESLIDYRKRSDGRYDVCYAEDPILIINRLPMTEFRESALRILIERHLTEVSQKERIALYERRSKP